MRGGSRPRTQAQRNSSNGLLGITFQWRLKKGREFPTPTICIAVRDKRFARGITKRGPDAAMRQAIALRRAAGLRAPALGRALDALQDWLDQGPQ